MNELSSPDKQRPGPVELWFVEWSDRAQYFRIITANQAMRENFQAWYEGTPTDFKPLAWFTCETSAREFVIAIDGKNRPRVTKDLNHGEN